MFQNGEAFARLERQLRAPVPAWTAPDMPAIPELIRRVNAALAERSTRPR